MREADDRLLGLEVASGLTRLRGQEEATTATVMELKGLLATREVDLAKMLRSATVRHPEVQRMRTEVVALRAKLASIEAPDGRATERRERIGISNGLVCEKPGKPDSALGGQPMPAWMAWNWRLGRCLVWIRPAVTARLALVGP